VVVVSDLSPCLWCIGEIDAEEAAEYLQSPEARKDRDDIYGVPKSKLQGGGPSVVSINGVVASLAVTEFILSITSIRKPKSHLSYRGSRGIVTTPTDPPEPNCYYCNVIKGQADEWKPDNYGID